MKKYPAFLLLLCLFVSCSQQSQPSKDPDEKITKAIADHRIKWRYAYETSKTLKDQLSEKIRYNENGTQAEYESYFTNGVFAKINFTYDKNGYLTQKIYDLVWDKNKQTVRYGYNEKGEQTEYTFYDSLDRIISTHAVKRKGNTEIVNNFDGKGKPTGISKKVYDKNNRIIKSEGKTFGYTLNKEGLPKEYYSLDSTNGIYVRTIVEYKNFLPVKKQVIYNDTSNISIRYVYQDANGKTVTP